MSALKKLSVLITAITCVVALAVLGEPSVQAEATAMADATPCARDKFDTELVKKACQEGQKAAQKAMKEFVKSVKKAKQDAGDADFNITCTDCHSKLNPSFPLQKDALAKFKTLAPLVGAK